MPAGVAPLRRLPLSLLLGGLTGVWALAVLLSLRLGSLELTWADWWAGWLAGPHGGTSASSILWQVRLPRVALASLTGAALAMAGAGLQGLFRNPLADPALIGVSQGGALGAVVGIVMFSSALLTLPWLLPLMALAGSLATAVLIFSLARGASGQVAAVTLLLAGIAINALAGALIGLLIYTSNASQLRQFTFWTLGSLEGATWPLLLAASLLIVPGLLWLSTQGRALNVLALGAAEAGHLGLDAPRWTRRLIAAVAAMVGASVALTGTIGFIGLVVPHTIRLLTGPDHRRLLPATAVGGAALLLWADGLARHLDPPRVVPVGILTALIGGPFFLWLLWRERAHWLGLER